MSGSGETVGASKNDKVTTPTPDQGEKGKEKMQETEREIRSTGVPNYFSYTRRTEVLGVKHRE